MNTAQCNRRDFLAMTGLAAAAGVAPGCLSQKVAKNEQTFLWGTLIHFGMNNWFSKPLQQCPFPGGLNAAQREAVRLEYGRADHVRFDEAVWGALSKKLRATNNSLVIDVAECLSYPSHPELAVKGSWSADKFRAELRRLRSLGFELIPKLNFSMTHDIWLGEYHLMVGTRKYYEVVSDLIGDVAEIFDTPRLFHLGLDEEIAKFQADEPIVAVRGRAKWWEDLKFYQNEVERRGMRAMIWSDFFRHHDGEAEIAEFKRHMSKAILQNPWWYQGIKKPAFDETKEKAVRNYVRLSDLGYEYVMCGSNCYACDENLEDTVRFCQRRLNPELCRGLIYAPWLEMNETLAPRIVEGAAQLGRARMLWESSGKRG